MKRLFFEGRHFDLLRLSRIRRIGQKNYAKYGDAPIIMAQYQTIEEAKAGRDYLRRRGAS